jgi:hypothetical protein
MFQEIIVLLIIFIALFFMGKRIYNVFANKNTGCGCDQEKCPVRARGVECDGDVCESCDQFVG